MGYPRAALFAFGVSALAYNVLAVLQAAVEAEHRLEEDSKMQVSSAPLAHQLVDGQPHAALLVISN